MHFFNSRILVPLDPLESHFPGNRMTENTILYTPAAMLAAIFLWEYVFDLSIPVLFSRVLNKDLVLLKCHKGGIWAACCSRTSALTVRNTESSLC